jgi:hypothetical protein
MKTIDLDRTNGTGAIISLKPGSAWLLYTDEGPTGPGAQCGRVTCPQTVIHTFENEDDMRSFMATFKPRSKKGQISHGVVDEYYAGSLLRLVDHRSQPLHPTDPPNL